MKTSRVMCLALFLTKLALVSATARISFAANEVKTLTGGTRSKTPATSARSVNVTITVMTDLELEPLPQETSRTVTLRLVDHEGPGKHLLVPLPLVEISNGLRVGRVTLVVRIDLDRHAKLLSSLKKKKVELVSYSCQVESMGH